MIEPVYTPAAEAALACLASRVDPADRDQLLKNLLWDAFGDADDAGDPVVDDARDPDDVDRDHLVRDLREAVAAPRRQAVIVAVSGGVAEHAASGGVDVALVDYDNLRDDATTRADVAEVRDAVAAFAADGPREFRDFCEAALAELDAIAASKPHSGRAAGEGAR